MMQIHPRLSWLLLGCFVSSSFFLWATTHQNKPIVFFSLFIYYPREEILIFFCCLVHVENLTKIHFHHEIKSLRTLRPFCLTTITGWSSGTRKTAMPFSL
jgi:hypothetical protein